jgi:hypothetical protein
MKRAKKITWIQDSSLQEYPTAISRQLRRLNEIGGRAPRLGFAIAWG